MSWLGYICIGSVVLFGVVAIGLMIYMACAFKDKRCLCYILSGDKK